MSDIAERLNSIKSTLPEGVELVAVSKFHPVAVLREAYNAGQRVFGESRVQELVDKIPEMPDDTRWHFIGHLQTNKLKYLIGNVSLIESVDSLRLLEMIDDLSFRKGVITRVLMQLHVAAEETKFGFTPAELIDWFATRGFESLKATHICGLMGMATNTDDDERISSDFRTVAETRKRIIEVAPDLRGFDILSMGMSDDYQAAIAEGSTHVRIGSAIFGQRVY
ncbi:MAG: YggS family pyridoxal phosphate-dependent enzyme [Muribaculaceae bacterium]|nr:YggS family pyridoxal phosphate-dependent enzyme [Muribaculaceae bacterium]